jgi:pyridinium-3,5-bisthiocarboxylic acid mononucleotide nickel chelatase
MKRKMLYFDTFNGASGDMILGALLDLGVPLRHIEEELKKLGIPDDFHLHVKPVERSGLYGSNFHVHIHDARRNHDHSGEHKHQRHESAGSPGHGHGTSRGFVEIKQLIEDSQLDPWVKDRAVQIFRRLGEAEARVHRSSLEHVHFHEVGAVDAIVDIVGACIGFRYLSVDEFYTAPLNLGGGTVVFSHGTWPVPAPATAELVKGFPVLTGNVLAELTTPTGAAIITTLVDRPGPPPAYTIEKSGFGAGDRELEGIPNMLRLLLANLSDSPDARQPEKDFLEEEVVMVEAAIDDMDAQVFGYFMGLALDQGALDVYFTPIQMKKNRPGVLLSVLCTKPESHKMAELIFRETTTLGLRFSSCKRWVLDREFQEIETEFGTVRAKIGRLRGEVVNLSPEYEDVRRLSQEAGLPLKAVRQKVIEQLGKLKI